MNILDINPFIRFASEIQYDAKGSYVYVRDCRIFYILSGEGEIYIDDVRYPFTDNTLFYCCSGSRYKISAKRTLSIMSLNFDLSQNYSSEANSYRPAKSIFNPKDIFRDIIADSDFLNSHLYIKDGVEFRKSLEKILWEFSAKTKYYMEMSSSVLKHMITRMHRYGQSANTTTSIPVNKAVEYIEKNLSKNITNGEIAKIAGYHEYYLNRMFISHIGMSMHKYIINRRMSKAQHLILNTDLPLKDISRLAGFNNYTHFSEYFKKYFELSPSSYKNHMKNKI